MLSVLFLLTFSIANFLPFFFLLSVYFEGVISSWLESRGDIGLSFPHSSVTVLCSALLRLLRIFLFFFLILKTIHSKYLFSIVTAFLLIRLFSFSIFSLDLFLFSLYFLSIYLFMSFFWVLYFSNLAFQVSFFRSFFLFLSTSSFTFAILFFFSIPPCFFSLYKLSFQSLFLFHLFSFYFYRTFHLLLLPFCKFNSLIFFILYRYIQLQVNS